MDDAIGLFQAAGKTVSLIDDAPGLVVMRTVCMLANEGADAVLQQVCDAAAVDTAMQRGVNHPLGPLAWADRLGPASVLRVLENLQAALRHRSLPAFAAAGERRLQGWVFTSRRK